MPKHTLTTQQKSTAKRLRSELRARIESGGGMTFKGEKGIGKTAMIGATNSKPLKEGKRVNLFIACQTAYAEKQAEEVGVAIGDKPLTKGRMSVLKRRLNDTDVATFALTPASASNLLNPNHAMQNEFMKTIKVSGVASVHIEIDEVHKSYMGRSNKPSQVVAFREKLRKDGISLLVTGITATPGWDVKSEAQVRVAKRACTLLGLEAVSDKSPVEVLKENTIEVSEQDAEAIFAVTKPLQTSAPETFKKRNVDILDGDPSQELKSVVDDAARLLLGLAIEGAQGHIDRVVGFKESLSKAVVQKVLDDRMIDRELDMDGVKCKTVVEAADGSFSLSEAVTTARANALIVVDSPEAAKYLKKELKERADDDPDARPMQFFDLTTRDRATFNKNLAGFVDATKTMKNGHPIGVIDPTQLEGSNDFGKNCFSIIAVGALFKPHLLKQGAGRLGRPVPLEAGDLVPIDGYKAVNITSKWQTALAKALKSKGTSLPNPVAELLNEYGEGRKKNHEDIFGDDEDEEPDPTLDRIETKAKQLAKVDAAKLFRSPVDGLAVTFMRAMLDEDTKEKHLCEAFGKLNLDKKTRTRAGSVLAKYLPTSNVEASDGDGEAGRDAVMEEVISDSSLSDSDSGNEH